MSSFDKKTKDSRQSTSTSELTNWSRQERERQVGGIVGTVDAFKNKPYVPFSGQLVAGMSPDQIAAREKARGITGPAPVNYRGFDVERVKARYNPHEQEVVNSVSQFYDDDMADKLADRQDFATRNGSYGGSRHGVGDASIVAQSLKDKTGIVSDLRYRGYNDALAGDERETGRIYEADRTNSNNAYDADLRSVEMMNALGMQERDIEQMKLLAEKAKYDEGAAEDWKRFILDLETQFKLLGTTPMLTTQTGSASGTSKTSDPLGSFGSLLDGLSRFPGLGIKGP